MTSICTSHEHLSAGDASHKSAGDASAGDASQERFHHFPMPKVFVSSTINAFIFYLEVGLETPPPKKKNRK